MRFLCYGRIFSQKAIVSIELKCTLSWQHPKNSVPIAHVKDSCAKNERLTYGGSWSNGITAHRNTMIYGL